MFKKLRKNEKGFTLAELLIVVAIIGVLVAISIPIFTSQLERSREAVDLANIRGAYAEVVASNLTDGQSHQKSVKATQGKSSWQGTNKGSIAGLASKVKAKTSGNYVVKITKDGDVTVQ